MSIRTSEDLCLACGLCCDGSLFDNVRLGESDDASLLKRRGLPVKLSRANKPMAFVRQPCPAFCGDKSCRVYADRPTQCRSFECGVYKEFEAGRLAETVALRLVKRARRKAERIRRLLNELGDTKEDRSLDKRFRRVQRRLESGVVDPADAERFGELGLAVHQLDLLAHRHFYTQA